MKKTIVILLISLSVFFLITACTAPEDPTENLSETTMSIVNAGTTAEPIPDETTTEPVDITSDDIVESSSEPSEETTVEPETTKEIIVCETEYHLGAWVYHLNPMTTLDATWETTEEPIKVADTETPWYITEWETQSTVEKPEVPEEKKNLAFRVPLVYEGICNEMQVKVEFFQEYYLIGEPIQVRITVKNRSSNTIFYESPQKRYPVVILKNGDWGTPRYDPFGKLNTDYFYLGDWGFEHVYWHDLYDYAEDSCRGFILNSTGDFSKYDNSDYHTFYDGVAVLEYTMKYSPLELTATDTYSFVFTWYSSYSSYGEQRVYRLTVPMDVVEVELVAQ